MTREARLDRHPDPHPGHRHQCDRRRRRLDRLDRRRRRAAGRADQRRGGAGPRLLRPRRRRADRHRRQPRARPARRRHEARRRIDARCRRRARAIEDRIAGPLGLDLVAAAAGILRVANATMVRGIRVVSVERGHDPRRLTLVPFGGAGPMHGSPLARELAIPRLLCRRPPASCARSACWSPTCGTIWCRRRLAAHARPVGGRGGARDLRADAGRGAPPAGRGPRARGAAADRDAGSTCAMSDSRYELPIPFAGFAARRHGRRWCRRSTPSTPAASATATPRAGRDRQLRRHRHRADRDAGAAAAAAGRSRAAGEARAAAPAGCISRPRSGRSAAAGPSARCGGARRCSPATRSPGRRLSRRFRRRRCSIRATAPGSMRSAA